MALEEEVGDRTHEQTYRQARQGGGEAKLSAETRGQSVMDKRAENYASPYPTSKII
ncbi:hypothetical protein DPMN_022718 [Dreissena polymorpha]|uniref:Uncharacterized protein n=1 Tax=Dreissena polymorpha TaxID=45954 RepID=A0A9D4SBZ9_DREPO|nr:hypothetical protein DPMN_022718 [Dreissena polymorpha]